MKIINKKNTYMLFLVVVCLLMLVIVPTYAKFPSTHTTADMVGVALDFKVSITDIEEYERLVVPAGDSLKFNVKVTNNTGALIYYGIWYRMVEPVSLISDGGISIGGLPGVETTTSGSIENASEVTVTIFIVNNSSSEVIVDIGVASSTTSTSDIEYLGGRYLIRGDIYQLLSEIPVGSYVNYTGNNGCVGDACNGQNANYVSDTDMGYCFDSNYKYNYNGWRIAYIDSDSSAHLVSGGAPECLHGTGLYSYTETMTTGDPANITQYYGWFGSSYTFNNVTGEFSLDGTIVGPNDFLEKYESLGDYYTCLGDQNSSCSTLYQIAEISGIGTAATVSSVNVLQSSAGVLSQAALNYCNIDYAKGGICDSTTAWAINESDFSTVTGYNLSADLCYNTDDSTEECTTEISSVLDSLGIIENGGYYWFSNSTAETLSSQLYYTASTSVPFATTSVFSSLYGLRPVLALDSSIVVISGTGTYTNPYTIVKP